MVQSALSRQLQRPGELGVLLLDRTTHHVELTPSGNAFLIEARLAASPEVPVAELAERLAPSRGSCRGGVGTP
jgi:DNA-binding transcriptional LysR family regulator